MQTLPTVILVTIIFMSAILIVFCIREIANSIKKERAYNAAMAKLKHIKLKRKYNSAESSINLMKLLLASKSVWHSKM